MGKALAPLRDEGVMIAASGAWHCECRPPFLVDLSGQVRTCTSFLEQGCPTTTCKVSTEEEGSRPPRRARCAC